MLRLLLENGADLYAINNVRFWCFFSHPPILKYAFGNLWVSSLGISRKPKNGGALCSRTLCMVWLQDGNTPYSFALSGGNMDTANYVMTYASKSPQRDSGGPVRIFNMQASKIITIAQK